QNGKSIMFTGGDGFDLNPWPVLFTHHVELSSGGFCCALSSISSFFISTIHLDRICSIYSKNDQSSEFHKRLNIIPPVFFWFTSNVVMCFGWWRGRRATCRKDVWIAVLTLYLGFPLSVWSGIILTDSSEEIVGGFRLGEFA